MVPPGNPIRCGPRRICLHEELGEISSYQRATIVVVVFGQLISRGVTEISDQKIIEKVGELLKASCYISLYIIYPYERRCTCTSYSRDAVNIYSSCAVVSTRFSLCPSPHITFLRLGCTPYRNDRHTIDFLYTFWNS